MEIGVDVSSFRDAPVWASWRATLGLGLAARGSLAPLAGRGWGEGALPRILSGAVEAHKLQLIPALLRRRRRPLIPTFSPRAGRRSRLNNKNRGQHGDLRSGSRRLARGMVLAPGRTPAHGARPRGVRADAHRRRRTLAPPPRRHRSRHPYSRRRQPDQMAGADGRGAGRAFLWRPGDLRRGRTGRAGHRDVRDAGCVSSRPRPKHCRCERDRGHDPSRATRRRDHPAAAAGRLVQGQRQRPRLGRRPMHAAADQVLHAEADADRRARAHRQQGLYPRRGLSQSDVRCRPRRRARKRLAHLRSPLRPRRHDRQAGAARGDFRKKWREDGVA